MPCFIDTNRRPVLSQMEREKEEFGQMGREGQETGTDRTGLEWAVAWMYNKQMNKTKKKKMYHQGYLKANNTGAKSPCISLEPFARVGQVTSSLHQHLQLQTLEINSDLLSTVRALPSWYHVLTRAPGPWQMDSRH